MVIPIRGRARALTLVDPTGVSPYSLDEVWAITRRLSPRDDVRAAARAASGEVLNAYDKLWPLNEAPPSTTCSFSLAGDLRLRRQLPRGWAYQGERRHRRDLIDLGEWFDEQLFEHVAGHSGLGCKLGHTELVRREMNEVVAARPDTPTLVRESTPPRGVSVSMRAPPEEARVGSRLWFGR